MPLIPAEAVIAWHDALAHAPKHGARVAALHTSRPTDGSTPERRKDVVLAGPPTLAASWGQQLRAAAGGWGRTTGSPWRVDV